MKFLTCSKCGTAGGTLVKVDDNYHHQDDKICNQRLHDRKLKELLQKPKSNLLIAHAKMPHVLTLQEVENGRKRNN